MNHHKLISKPCFISSRHYCDIIGKISIIKLIIIHPFTSTANM
jgi:hypothetical protein